MQFGSGVAVAVVYASAAALIRPLDQELSYAAGVAVKRGEKKKPKNKVTHVILQSYSWAYIWR